jgi:hypothetical protein
VPEVATMQEPIARRLNRFENELTIATGIVSSDISITMPMTLMLRTIVAATIIIIT